MTEDLHKSNFQVQMRHLFSLKRLLVTWKSVDVFLWLHRELFHTIYVNIAIKISGIEMCVKAQG